MLGKYNFIILIWLTLNMVVFCSKESDAKYLEIYIYEITKDSIPSVNQEIIRFVDSKIGKKVGRGQCWDLAAEALNKVGAKWDGSFRFGKLVDPKVDVIFPGDIIQFKGVKLKYQEGDRVYWELMKQHTAIVYKVKGKGVFDIAHQNTAFSRKKVGISELKIDNMTRGKMKFYRPVKE